VSSSSTSAAGSETIGARPIPELHGVRDVWPRGDRLEAIRSAGSDYKRRFKSQGRVSGVRAVNIAAAPYPVQYAFHGAVLAPHAPMLSIVNRMVVVQYEDWEGTPRTLPDLAGHRFVLFGPPDTRELLRLIGPRGEESIRISGPLVVDDLAFGTDAVAAGAGPERGPVCRRRHRRR